MSKQKRRSVGRTNLYKEIWQHRLDDIEQWAKEGLSNKQIAHNMGIADGTLYRWMLENSELSKTIKKGKRVIDKQVENALHQKAMGSTYVETKEIIKNGEVVGVERTTKQLAPDTTAQIFWLKNRQPQDWRDRHHLDHQGQMEVTNPLSGLTTEELRKMANDSKSTE